MNSFAFIPAGYDVSPASMNADQLVTPPPDLHARIVARSRRQAMDWSLVLASQEIHPIIEGPGETPNWSLLVEPQQHERALNAIRQYRLENRSWAWRHELPGSALEIHVGALFWCLFLAFWDWTANFVWPALETAGRMDSVRVHAGEWWRLFTALMLHADLAHLMANATFGVVILGFAMARFGPGIALLATYLAGVFGNVAGLLFYSHPYTGLGASGMMMGALGLLCVHSFGLCRKRSSAARYVLSGVFSGVLLFVLFGSNPGSDVLAHLGGFVAGLGQGMVLSVLPQERLAKRRLNLVALAVLLVSFVLTWGLALR